MEYIFLILPFVALIYSAGRLFLLEKRARKNRKILMALRELKQEETFFHQLDILMKDEKSEEFLEKLRIIKLWGDVYHQRFDDFKKQLEILNLMKVMFPKGKKNKIALNEDSFFYLFLVIPNRLYYLHQSELRELVYTKIASVQSDTDMELFSWIQEANRKFYNHTEDRGRSIYEAILNGEYSGYHYSKQLIGLYKDIVATMLMKLAEDMSDKSIIDNEIDRISAFHQTSFGARWMEEIGYVWNKGETL